MVVEVRIEGGVLSKDRVEVLKTRKVF